MDIQGAFLLGFLSEDFQRIIEIGIPGYPCTKNAAIPKIRWGYVNLIHTRISTHILLFWGGKSSEMINHFDSIYAVFT